MSITRLIVAGALFISLAASAFAQQTEALSSGPVLFGRKDFEVEWKVEPYKLVLSARYFAERRLMRFEIPDGSGRAVVRNLASGDALYIVGQGQGGAYRYQLVPLGRFQPGAPGGTRQIGSEQCRDFDAGGVLLCLTDDGIPLRIALAQGTLTASRLLRQPQHPALFDLPKGQEAKPLPPGMQPLPLPF